jgi:hypothetical protein
MQNLDFDQLILEFYTPGETKTADGYIVVTLPTNQENNSYMLFKSEGKTKYKTCNR